MRGKSVFYILKVLCSLLEGSFWFQWQCREYPERYKMKLPWKCKPSLKSPSQLWPISTILAFIWGNCHKEFSIYLSEWFTQPLIFSTHFYLNATILLHSISLYGYCSRANHRPQMPSLMLKSMTPNLDLIPELLLFQSLRKVILVNSVKCSGHLSNVWLGLSHPSSPSPIEKKRQFAYKKILAVPHSPKMAWSKNSPFFSFVHCSLSY